MAEFFPRKTIVWTQIDEPTFLRRLTSSLVAMGLVTGVVLRLLRALTLRHEATSLLYIVGMVALGTVLLLGAVTAHLGNYTLRHWWWRAVVFALVESAAEMAASAALIAAGAERVGTARAAWVDWPDMAARTVQVNVLFVGVFALVLAGVVQVIRWLMLRAERRTSTAAAVQRGSAEHRRASFEVTTQDAAPDE